MKRRPNHYVCRKHGGCALDTDQAALFELHVKEKGHGCRRETPPRLPRKLWTAPRLTEEGKPFEPTGLEPGATVTWKQLVPTGDAYFDGELGRTRDVMEWVERTGQVWSRGGPPKSAWVIPFDEIPDEAEVAVLVRASSLDSALYHSQTYAPARSAAA